MAENMQEETFDTRTRRLIGEEAAQRLRNAKVAVFGIGGVGSYCVEALARCGVGHLVLTDGDRVSPSNLNRQLIALHSTVGCLKTEAAARRIADICPETETELHSVYFTAETESQFDFSSYHYIIDAVDMVSAKLLMIEKAEEIGMSTGPCHAHGAAQTRDSKAARGIFPGETHETGGAGPCAGQYFFCPGCGRAYFSR